jgi:hypothetical protein
MSTAWREFTRSFHLEMTDAYHIEVRITEKLVTKTAMEAKAAMSRMMSVICLSILFMF